MIKLMTWNIRQGGSTRSPAICDRVDAHNPDIVVLTEFRNNDFGDAIRGRLQDAGWTFQLSLPAARSVNSLLVASKLPFENLGLEIPYEEHKHRLAAVKVGGVHLLGFYFPQNHAKIPLYEYILELPDSITVAPSIMIGDFNTGLRLVDEIGKTFIAADLFKRLGETHWVDAWRHFHGDTREYSWYGRTGNGFRIDHAFVSKAMLPKVTGVWYSHQERETNLSDHSAMLLTISSLD